MVSTLSRSRKIALLFAAGLFYVGTVWSADHMQIRNIMIESQLAQVETTAVLMVGDSIVESWLIGPAGPCQVINAGLGGGVLNVITLLHELKQKSNRAKLSGIVVAIGVNDARLRDLSPNYVAKWKNDYAEMINLALQLNSRVVVSTILPVEENMPLGTKYFDPILIGQLNTSIRQVAKEKNVRLIDTNKIFLNAIQKKHFTVDGVHLTPDSYKIFTNTLMQGMPVNCRSAALEQKPLGSALPN